MLRIGTILGERVDNQITALFRAAPAAEDPRLARRRSCSSGTPTSPAIIQRAVTGEVTGIFNVAGDGALTVDEIAAALGKPQLTLPEPVLRSALAVGRRLGLTAYGPEQTTFLQYRPVLDNTRSRTLRLRAVAHQREAFEAWRVSRRAD